MRGYIRVVGILFAIVGVVGFLAHGAMSVYFALHPEVVQQMTRDMFRNAPVPTDPKVTGAIAPIEYGFWALLSLFYVAGGISIYRVRNRPLCLAAMILSLVPCLSSNPCCTYLPLVGVSIFGLIVLFNADAVDAFNQVARGVPVDQALQPPPPPAQGP